MSALLVNWFIVYTFWTLTDIFISPTRMTNKSATLQDYSPSSTHAYIWQTSQSIVVTDYPFKSLKEYYIFYMITLITELTADFNFTWKKNSHIVNVLKIPHDVCPKLIAFIRVIFWIVLALSVVPVNCLTISCCTRGEWILDINSKWWRYRIYVVII